MFQFIDSDEDNDGYVDTDEEVSNGRVNLLNGSGPPYFHGYLYMKSEELFCRVCSFMSTQSVEEYACVDIL